MEWSTMLHIMLLSQERNWLSVVKKTRIVDKSFQRSITAIHLQSLVNFQDLGQMWSSSTTSSGMNRRAIYTNTLHTFSSSLPICPAIQDVFHQRKKFSPIARSWVVKVGWVVGCVECALPISILAARFTYYCSDRSEVSHGHQQGGG